MGVQIDQSGPDPAAAGVDFASSAGCFTDISNGGDLSVDDEDVGDLVRMLPHY
jgi:hypothetical protein